MTTYKISQDIRSDIANAIVTESQPDYDPSYAVRYYAVDTDGDNTFDAVMTKSDNAPWAPWTDNSVAVAVERLYEDSAATFDPTPDSDLSDDDDNRNDEEFAQDAWDNAVILAESELPETWTDEE